MTNQEQRLVETIRNAKNPEKTLIFAVKLIQAVLELPAENWKEQAKAAAAEIEREVFEK